MAGFFRDVVVCPAGKVALGGGARVLQQGSTNFGTAIQESAPTTVDGNSGWLVMMSDVGINHYTVGIFAICASV